MYVDDSLDRRNRQEFNEASRYRSGSSSPHRRSSYRRDRSDREERTHNRDRSPRSPYSSRRHHSGRVYDSTPTERDLFDPAVLERIASAIEPSLTRKFESKLDLILLTRKRPRSSLSNYCTNVTTKGSSRGRDRVKSVHSGTTSFREKKSNSTRESPIPSDQTSEREHSPEPLDTLYPEEEGPLPAGQSFQDPSDSESLDSGLRRDSPDVRLRSSSKISHIRQSRKLHTTPHHHQTDELRRLYVDE